MIRSEKTCHSSVTYLTEIPSFGSLFCSYYCSIAIVAMELIRNNRSGCSTAKNAKMNEISYLEGGK